MEAIVATDLLGGIGKNNSIPWYSKTDIRFFLNKTINNVVIMGKNTFLSLPNKKPLKNRLNIVLTHNPELYTNEFNLLFTNNFNVFLNDRTFFLNNYPYLNNDFKFFIIGGKQIYDKYISICDVYWVTTIKKIYHCDIFFNFDLLNKEYIFDNIFYQDGEIQIKKYIKK